MFFSVSCHIPGPTVYISHFPRFSLFFFSYIPGPIVYFSHFLMFFSFLAIFQVLAWAFLNFHVFQCFSPYSRSYSVCFSFSIFFNFLAIIQVLQFSFFIFHVFQCFSPYSISYSVPFSFFRFLNFLAIFQVLQCAFLIFYIFQCFLPYSMSNSVCVCVSVCLSVCVCFCVYPFPRVSVFLTYYRSYSVRFSFSTFFSVSRHIPFPLVCLSHFSPFSVFWPYSRS